MHRIKSNYFAIAIIIIILWVGLFLIFNSIHKKIAATPTLPISSPMISLISTPSAQVLGARTKTADCHINGPLPDPACTPGAAFPNLTREQICTPGYASSVRNVSQSTKNKVFEEYGLPPTGHQPGEYEVDHLISLELGGSNEISNLFPEAAEPRPGFHEKDKVENYLHDQLCTGAITLEQAQLEISSNWLVIYQQIPNGK